MAFRDRCFAHTLLFCWSILFSLSLKLAADEPTSGWRQNTDSGRRKGSYSSAVLTKDEFVISGVCSGAFNDRSDVSEDRGILIRQGFGNETSDFLFEGHAADISLAISHNGKWLAIGTWIPGSTELRDEAVPSDEKGGVTLRNLSSGERIWSHEAHGSIVHAVVFSPDDTKLVSFASDETVKLWDTSTGELLKTFQHNAIPLDGTFTPDGKTFVAVGSHNFSQAWDVATGGTTKMDFGHLRRAHAVRFAPVKRTLATASRNVILWDWKEKRVLRKLDVEKRIGEVSTHSLAFSPDGKTIATGHSNGSVGFWKSSTGQLIRTTRNHTEPKPYGSIVHSIGYHVDGKWLFSADESGKIIKLDAATGKPISVLLSAQE